MYTACSAWDGGNTSDLSYDDFGVCREDAPSLAHRRTCRSGSARRLAGHGRQALIVWARGPSLHSLSEKQGGRTLPTKQAIIGTISRMPDYVRWREKGATYFFTMVTYRRRALFHHSHNRRLLRSALLDVCHDWPFEMFACALLPDHLHCIWTLPADDDRFPARWAVIKRRFTDDYLASGGVSLPVSDSRRARGERGVLQPRYWEHLIRDERDLFQHRDYIHMNPVKHGYVEHPVDWPWSSIHRHIRLGWLDPAWPGETPVTLSDVPHD